LAATSLKSAPASAVGTPGENGGAASGKYYNDQRRYGDAAMRDRFKALRTYLMAAENAIDMARTGIR